MYRNLPLKPTYVPQPILKTSSLIDARLANTTEQRILRDNISMINRFNLACLLVDQSHSFIPQSDECENALYHK